MYVTSANVGYQHNLDVSKYQLRNNSNVYEELLTSIGDLMVENAVSLEAWSAICKTNISHCQITNWCRQHFKYNAIIPVLFYLIFKNFKFFTKINVKIPNKVMASMNYFLNIYLPIFINIIYMYIWWRKKHKTANTL